MGQLLKRSALCLALGLAIMVFVINFGLPRRNPKWVNFEKIKPGMTKTEVESILGEDECYFPYGLDPIQLEWMVDATIFTDEYCLQASFDRKWKVTETRSYTVEPSHLRRFLGSLGW